MLISRADLYKKLEAQKARMTGVLNALVGLFSALTLVFFLANRGSGTNEHIWIVVGLLTFTLVLVGFRRVYLRKVANLREIIEEELSSGNLVKSN